MPTGSVNDRTANLAQWMDIACGIADRAINAPDERKVTIAIQAMKTLKRFRRDIQILIASETDISTMSRIQEAAQKLDELHKEVSNKCLLLEE